MTTVDILVEEQQNCYKLYVDGRVKKRIEKNKDLPFGAYIPELATIKSMAFNEACQVIEEGDIPVCTTKMMD